MKKQIVAALAVSVMATSTMASWAEGKIGKITGLDDGRIAVEIITTDGLPFFFINSADAENEKKMITMFLTAKASDMNVKAEETGGFWTRLILL